MPSDLKPKPPNPFTGHHVQAPRRVDGSIGWDTFTTKAPSLSLNFNQLEMIEIQIGKAAFAEMAPQMYALYQEMKNINNFKKMSDILEDK